MDRTHRLDGAHVAMPAAASNPVACTVGPSMSAGELLVLCFRLDPDQEPGRMTPTVRMGAVADRPINLVGGGFDIAHEDYAELVRSIIEVKVSSASTISTRAPANTVAPAGAGSSQNLATVSLRLAGASLTWWCAPNRAAGVAPSAASRPPAFARVSATSEAVDESYTVDGYDPVVMGPGRGDPTRVDDPKISGLRATIRRRLARRAPFVAVCLSYQVQIGPFGRSAVVGFYNTFAPRATRHSVCHPSVFGAVEFSRDGATGETHAVRSARLQSMQSHAESVLNRDGLRVLREVFTGLLPRASTDVNRRGAA